MNERDIKPITVIYMDAGRSMFAFQSSDLQTLMNWTAIEKPPHSLRSAFTASQPMHFTERSMSLTVFFLPVIDASC